jgi:hypothetical protein
MMEMNMKREFALAGIALVVSILLSSPTLAQTPQLQPAAADARVPIELVAPALAEELSMDDAIMLARTQEERTAVLRRCSGPPPRLRAPAVTEAPARAPAIPVE